MTDARLSTIPSAGELPVGDLFGAMKAEIEAGRVAEDGTVVVEVARDGPAELYGAIGVAMFKADLGGLRIDQKINVVGNAAFAAQTISGKGMREALDDAMATIAAVRATASAEDEWAGAAKHFYRVCGITLQKCRRLVDQGERG